MSEGTFLYSNTISCSLKPTSLTSAKVLVPLRTRRDTFDKSGKVFGLSFIPIIVLIFYVWSFNSTFSIRHQNTLRMHSGNYIFTTSSTGLSPGVQSLSLPVLHYSVTLQGNQNLKEEITMEHNMRNITVFWDFTPCVLLDRHDVSDEPNVYTFKTEYEEIRG
jgi:hypothetical protein